MDDYRNIDQLRTNELAIIKKGFWKPEFELTDGQFVYAKLRFRSNFKRDAIIETPQETFTIKRKGWFNRTVLVNKGEDEIIGVLVPETWKRDFNLKMDNGFEATYLYKKMFSKSLSLTNGTQGDILTITQKAFNFKQPYTVTIDQVTQQPNTPLLPLLAFMGLVIIMLRQQQAATQ
ncbi:hypothetical protein NAF17_07110 [Mucilaginibacter sp. RB4R14]|uniref:hypothetical protein n=1 Tax=Mucilaginibacter aurantiaciroseus TaxID=2949308 RepID=UPI0020912A73|nr:hypothetical protein [Mucilaginibacter aurantiaciroseus]MCO5935303.1 hypothetical protein [Mucilaginibacter aurantiaciroseus]